MSILSDFLASFIICSALVFLIFSYWHGFKIRVGSKKNVRFRIRVRGFRTFFK